MTENVQLSPNSSAVWIAVRPSFQAAQYTCLRRTFRLDGTPQSLRCRRRCSSIERQFRSCCWNYLGHFHLLHKVRKGETPERKHRYRYHVILGEHWVAEKEREVH